MRTVGSCQRAFDMMCERALSRVTQGEVLAKKQMVQEKIADSYIQLQQFRLLVLHAAWTLDQKDSKRGRTEIAMVKVLTPEVLHDIVYRALHIHGSLGTSNEMPLMGMWSMMPVMGIADGPHRGAQGDDRPSGAQGVQAVAGPVPERAPAAAHRSRQEEVRRPARARRRPALTETL
jgi:acyl-CoA dehydrogenase